MTTVSFASTSLGKCTFKPCHPLDRPDRSGPNITQMPCLQVGTQPAGYCAWLSAECAISHTHPGGFQYRHWGSSTSRRHARMTVAPRMLTTVASSYSTTETGMARLCCCDSSWQLYTATTLAESRTVLADSRTLLADSRKSAKEKQSYVFFICFLAIDTNCDRCFYLVTLYCVTVTQTVTYVTILYRLLPLTISLTCEIDAFQFVKF